MLPKETAQLEKAIVNSNLSGSARVVLREIMRRSNDAGECEVSIGTLAEHCGYCMRTINHRMTELIQKGWVIRTEQFNEIDGHQMENLYRIQKSMKGQEEALSIIEGKKVKETTELVKAMAKSNLSGPARAVLGEIKKRSNDAGECEVSMSNLAEHCGYCICTINCSVNELIQKGWIIRKEQFDAGDNRRLENAFYIKKSDRGQRQALYSKMDHQTPKIAHNEQDIDIDALKETIEKAEYTQSAKKILTVLASYMERNEPYVSVSTLIDECEYSGKIIRVRLKELGEKGWIIKICQRHSENGTQLANLYRIKMPDR